MNPMTTKKTWLVILPLAGLALVYLFVFFLPGQQRIRQLRETLTQGQDFLAETTYVLPALKATSGRLVELHRVCRAWEQCTPDDDQLASLFGRINLLARNARATTNRFDPQTATDFESVRQIPVEMQCTGTYAQLVALLRGLETMAEPVWVDSVDLQPASEDGQIIQCELNLVVFTDNSEISGQANASD